MQPPLVFEMYVQSVSSDEVVGLATIFSGGNEVAEFSSLPLPEVPVPEEGSCAPTA